MVFVNSLQGNQTLAMIKTVLFDLGNVLVQFSHEKMYRQLGDVCGISSESMCQLLDDTQLYHSLELGKMEASEFVESLQAQLGKELDRDSVIQAGSDIFTPLEGMGTIIDRLSSAGIRTVLISNTCRAHFEHVQKSFSVLERLDDFVLSFEVGYRKPAHEIYQAAKQKIECDPAECLYVDDIREFVETGKSLGFQGHVFTGPLEFSQCLQSHGLSGIE